MAHAMHALLPRVHALPRTPCAIPGPTDLWVLMLEPITRWCTMGRLCLLAARSWQAKRPLPLAALAGRCLARLLGSSGNGIHAAGWPCPCCSVGGWDAMAARLSMMPHVWQQEGRLGRSCTGSWPPAAGNSGGVLVNHKMVVRHALGSDVCVLNSVGKYIYVTLSGWPEAII